MQSEFNRVRAVFDTEIEGCRNVVGIADNLGVSTPALELDDLYRHSLAGAVSALDTCIHSIVRSGIILQLRGIGPKPDAHLPVATDLFRRWYSRDYSALGEIELSLRTAHGRWTMQSSKDIADAVKLVSSKPLWISIADQDRQAAGLLKESLDVVVKRRNQIVHESDIDPSTGMKWPINSPLALTAIDVLQERGHAVLDHVAAEY